MNVSKINILMVLAALLASTSFARSSGPGWYFGGSASFNSLDQGADYFSTVKHGGGGALVLGYYLRDRVRLELEGGQQVNDYGPRPHNLETGKQAGVDEGKFRRDFIMANLLFDVPLSERWDFNLGAGVGVMRFRGSIFLDRLFIALPPSDPGFAPHRDSEDYRLYRIAGQVLAGFTFHLTPRFALTASYRLAEASKASYRTNRINTGGFSSGEFGVRITL